MIDADSLDSAAAQAAATAQASQASASNAVLVGASRSQTGHPFFVAGPQVGYFYPEILYEVDVHGGGIDARGATFPGSGPYVELGRGPDFSWSATSSGQRHHRHLRRGALRRTTRTTASTASAVEMTTFDAGTLGRLRRRHGPVIFKETVHGPVIGYATVERRARRDLVHALDPRPRGRERVRVRRPERRRRPRRRRASSTRRQRDRVHVQLVLRGQGRHRDVLERPPAGPPPAGRPRAADDRHRQVRVARVPHGRPAPARQSNPSGRQRSSTGTTSRRRAGRPRTTSGATARCTAASCSSTRSTAGRRTRWRPRSAAMNNAATQDLRDAQGSAAIDGGARDTGRRRAPRDAADARAARRSWRAEGSQPARRATSTGTIDDPGAAIMDKAWPKIADAVMGPVLGPQLGDLASLMSRDNRPTTRARRTAPAGTATSTRTCARCSAGLSRGRSRRGSAARAT